MATNSETIKEFLVSIMFGVDKNSETRAKKSIEGIEKNLESLAKIAASAGVALFIKKTAESLEKLYYQSQRIKSSTENIKAFQGAIESLGGSAEDALASMENMAQKLRNGPGFYGMLEDLGVKTKDVNGNIRDQVDLMAELSQKLAKMPHYQANSYANALGIDERTLLAMKDGKFLAQMQKYRDIRRQMGLTDKDAKMGQEFSQQMRQTSMIMGFAFEKLGTILIKVLLPPLKWVNVQAERLLSWFESLPESTKEAIARIAKIAAVIVAFQVAISTILPVLKAFTIAMRLLNLSFLMSPIGIILALAAAIALLWDDYQTWKEGGKSLIDWEKWEPGIIAAKNGVDSITTAIKNLGAAIYEFIEKHTPKFADWIGKAATSIAAAFGDKKAQAALEDMANAAANDGVYNPRDANPAPLNNRQPESNPNGFNMHPLKGKHRITSGIGGRNTGIEGASTNHKGVDYAAPAGTPIHAPGTGTVSRTGFQKGKAGYYIVLQHDNGYETKFFHMKEMSGLKAGQRVNAGDVIGLVGSTGASSGAHLHYEVRKNGQLLDPTKVNHSTNKTNGLPSGGNALSNLGSVISKGEGGYNSYNRGTIGKKIIGATHNGNITNLTVSDILRRQAIKDPNNTNRIFAFGKYQMIPSTFKDAVNKMGLNGDEMMTPELQERIFLEYLIKKRPALYNYITGQSNDKQAALDAAALEWASIEWRGTGKPAPGYAKHGNKASTSTKQIEAAIEAARRTHTGGNAKNVLGGFSAKNNLLGNISRNSNMVAGMNPALLPNMGGTTNNNVTVAPVTNITVHGTNNPQETATLTAQKVDDTNSKLTRSFQVVYG